MRIAYVCSDRGVPIGGTKGASIHVRAVAQALTMRGHEVRLLATRAESPPPAFRPRVIDVGFDRLLKQLRQAIDDGGDALLAKEAYNLLLNTRMRQALAETNAEWPVDAVYERYSLWSWAGLDFARDRGIPWLLEVNAPLVDEQQSYRELSLRPVARGLERVLMREADAVIVPTADLRPHVWEAAGKRRKIHVVPNGADLDLFEHPPCVPPREVVDRLRDRFVVAFLGTLKPWHGIGLLVRAFERLRRKVPSAHLLVIGDGPTRPLVEEAMHEAGPDSVTLTGSVAHDEVPGWLALADVGVAPYPHLDEFYFCPLKVIEYLAAGLPVVASDIGELPRLVRHERTGLIVQAGDSRALASELVRLAGQRRERERMGRRARQQALRRHGWPHAAERIERILTDCSQKGDPSRRLAAVQAGS
jgi:glycosyltransferase involved in cell wall biosynthesis